MLRSKPSNDTSELPALIPLTLVASSLVNLARDIERAQIARGDAGKQLKALAGHVERHARGEQINRST